jgi:dUTP pyrophosphatase
MKMEVIIKSDHQLPVYSTDASTDVDLRTSLEKEILLKTMKRAEVQTGLFIELPFGYEAQIRMGNRIAIKKGITVLNSYERPDVGWAGTEFVLFL